MKLSDAIAYRETGECPIDIKKAVKCWGLAFISENKSHGTFRLVNRFAKVKVTISKEDAESLIKALNLVESPSGLFNASTWHKAEQRKF